MNCFCIIFSLFFMIHGLFSQVTNNFSDGDDKKSLSLKLRPLPEIQEDDSVETNEQEDDLSMQEIAELEFVFKYSPKKAQVIVNHLTDAGYFPHNRDYRSAYFVGDPGSGKTSMARSIGYKMSKKGWDYKFIGSTELLGEYRNQTARQLKKELQKIVDSKRPTIVVIDELHRLLENTESQHHDTGTAAIDAVKENLKHNAEKIVAWLETNPPLNHKKTFDFLHSHTIGKGIIKGKKNGLSPLTKSTVVLIPCPKNEFGFEIITSFPIPT